MAVASNIDGNTPRAATGRKSLRSASDRGQTGEGSITDCSQNMHTHTAKATCTCTPICIGNLHTYVHAYYICMYVYIYILMYVCTYVQLAGKNQFVCMALQSDSNCYSNATSYTTCMMITWWSHDGHMMVTWWSYDVVATVWQLLIYGIGCHT